MRVPGPVPEETAETAEVDRPRAGRSGRLLGVDAARGLALVGMMAVHVLPDRDGDGSVSLSFQLAGGRASALFAVLAGVGLALGSGGTDPTSGQRLKAARRSVAARSAVIAAIGLSLGSLHADVAVILAHYGVLFLVALPVLGWTARRLAWLAAAFALLAPVASQALRTLLPDIGKGDNVQWADLADPERLLGSVLLFGYYPVLTWTAYLYAGMAVGRCTLGRAGTATRIAAAGGLLAVAGLGVHALAGSLAGGTAGLAAHLGMPVAVVERVLQTTSFGTTPTNSWWWLLLAGRHSGSGPDLLHTGGSALLVLGCCQLVVPRLGRGWVLFGPLVAAGAMTLTLYTMHVLVLTATGSGGGPGQVPTPVVFAMHVAAACWIAVLAGAPARRGPLERLAAAAARRAAAGRAEPRGPAVRRLRRPTTPAPGAPEPPPAPEPPEAPGDGPPSAGTPHG